MQTKTPLTPTDSYIWYTYKMDVRQRSIMGGTANENFIAATIKKALVSKNETGYIYQIDTIERKQTNLEGIRAMEDDIFQLQNELIVQTDFSGLPIRIVNLTPIRDKWLAFRAKFKKKHKNQENISNIILEIDSLLNNNKLFTINFIESEIGTLFFPPIYGSLTNPDDTIKQHKKFDDFFAQSPLPLNITTLLKERQPNDKMVLVKRFGELDTEKFDHYAVRKFFRKMADNIKLAIPVKVNYIESFDLNKFHAITHSGQILNVQIEALFTFEQIARVTPLNTEL
ncbi:hypothetical protein [Cellulophaga baltica]|uniref:hypothetical protein n=1 Tax=Cellulophaga baltica TaxID=76594 RepID=UPI00041C75AF|nr:hypothetical protein [Cellulophaga baltica]AIY14026.1 hypothetical protein M667_12895 [Cellulophaga baltica NN016038]